MQNRKQSPSKQKNSCLAFKAGLSFFLFILTVMLGIAVFSAVCNGNAEWSIITDAVLDTDMSGTGTLPVPPYGNGFVADISEFEEYINPIHKLRDNFLTLINRDNPAGDTSLPDDLTAIPQALTSGGRDNVFLSLYAAKALEAMFTEIKAQNVEITDPKTKITLSVTLGYVSYNDQAAKFENEVSKLMRNDETLSRKMAEDIAETTVSRPGKDEHQSGLSADIHNCASNSLSFKNSEAYIWLKENSWKFGFILRYPEDKTEITGVQFEPWHYIYVGRYHAKEMVERNLCLEEYIDFLLSQQN